MKTTSVALLLLLALCSSSSRGQTLEWIRQLGTSEREQNNGVSADGLENVYISGETRGDLGGPNAGGSDAFLSKYDAGGTLQWTEQLGTSENDVSYGLSADGLGSVYISGVTRGDLGGPNAGDNDAFLSKYDAGGTLQWTEQLGTSENDWSYGPSADGLGNVYISGWTKGSLEEPFAGGFSDAFLSKYDAGGTLQWTRQLGTDEGDASWGVSADGLGNVYMSGDTGGSLGGPNAGSSDAFISKYDASGTLHWTRQLGSTELDDSVRVSADGLGNVYISGRTFGSLGGPNAGGVDAFLAKYDANGTLHWARQLGTSEQDRALGVSADGLGSVYISGLTEGSLGGPNAGGADAFISKYDASGRLQWTQQLGTSEGDASWGVSADGLGNVYMSGDTGGSLGGPNAGGGDSFVAKFSNPFDFDGDGDMDGGDADALVGEIFAGTNNPAFDLTADEAVNKADLIQWLGAAATANGFAASYLFGDANLDGSVDSADLNNLALSWRQGVARWSAGDFTADGTVDASDLNQLAINWQNAIPNAPIAGAILLTAGSDAYIQTFDEALGTDGAVIGTKLPTGWTVTDNGIVGESTMRPFPIGISMTGTTTSTFNAGAENDPDRALAIGVTDNPDEMFVQLLAQAGNDADSFQLQFDVEAWDAADGFSVGGNTIIPSADNPGEAAFKLTVDIDSGDGFTSLVDLGTVTTGPTLEPVLEGIVDGNADANRISFGSGVVSTSIPRDSLLRFRWAPDFDAQTNGWVFGIDNVSLSLFTSGTTASVPEPSAFILLLLGIIATPLLRHGRRSGRFRHV